MENNKTKDISFIVPAYNESGTIGKIVSDLKSVYPESEIIVIDDGSQDDTAIKAIDAGATVYSHPYNIGNGAAIKSGVRIATKKIVVFMDADGQHNPSDVEKLIAYLPQYDMVVGERIKQYNTSWVRWLGNTLLNKFGSYVAKFKIKDLTSGFRAIKTDIIKKFLYLLPNTYSYPTTLTLCLLRSGRSVKYVPIDSQSRKAGKSDIKVIKDGGRFFMIILKICILYSPLRMFLPLSGSIFITGILYYVYTFFVHHRFTNMGALLFSTAIIIFMIGLVSEQICQMRFDQSENG